MRRSLTTALLVLGVAAAFAGAAALVAPPSFGGPPDPGDSPRIERLEGDESGIYPFISKGERFPGHSPINLLVRGNTSEVVDALVHREGTAWRPADDGGGDAHPDDLAPRGSPTAEAIWGEAEGSDRYAYVHDGDRGRWVLPAAQLQDGTYFGARLHLRLYESPNASEPWVAIQAHTEYFDWFTLRHEVDGVDDAQSQVEADFMGQPGVRDVVRRFLDNQGPYDHDGWATVVELAVLLPLAAAGAGAGRPGGGLRDRARAFAGSHLTPADRRRLEALRRRITRRHGTLAVAVAAVPLGVRAAGLLLETYAGFLHVYAVAALLYPLVAVGIPVVAYVAAHRMQRRVDAGVTAALALGAAVIADFAVVGARTLPLDVVLQRAGLVLGVGLVAAGASRRATRDHRVNDLVLAGATVWVGVLAATLLGLG